MIAPKNHDRLKKGVQEEMEEVIGDQRKEGQGIILTLGGDLLVGLFWSGICNARDIKRDGW